METLGCFLCFTAEALARAELQLPQGMQQAQGRLSSNLFTLLGPRFSISLLMQFIIKFPGLLRQWPLAAAWRGWTTVGAQEPWRGSHFPPMPGCQTRPSSGICFPGVVLEPRGAISLLQGMGSTRLQGLILPFLLLWWTPLRTGGGQRVLSPGLGQTGLHSPAVPGCWSPPCCPAGARWR